MSDLHCARRSWRTSMWWENATAARKLITFPAAPVGSERLPLRGPLATHSGQKTCSGEIVSCRYSLCAPHHEECVRPSRRSSNHDNARQTQLATSGPAGRRRSPGCGGHAGRRSEAGGGRHVLGRRQAQLRGRPRALVDGRPFLHDDAPGAHQHHRACARPGQASCARPGAKKHHGAALCAGTRPCASTDRS